MREYVGKSISDFKMGCDPLRYANIASLGLNVFGDRKKSLSDMKQDLYFSHVERFFRDRVEDLADFQLRVGT